MQTEFMKIKRITARRAEDRFTMEKGSFTYETVVFEEKNMPVECLTSTDFSEGISRCSLRKDAEIPENFNQFVLTFTADPAEHLYGCGETYSEWDLKGQYLRIWTAEHQNAKRIAAKTVRETEKGIDPDYVLPFEAYESYYVQPTFVSSLKYFVHIDTDCFTEFDFSVPGETRIILREKPEIYIGRAESFPALSRLLKSLIGGQKRLPAWTHDGVIIAVQQGTEAVEKKLETAEKAGIPVCGVWSQDWCGCRKTAFGYQVMWNWEYHRELYHDLPEKIRDWREKGVRFLGYINPFMAIEGPIYREAHEKGYCVKDRTGADYLVTITTFPAAMIDFTNPEAYDWYKNIIKKNLIGIGLSGWMADFGEYLPADAVLSSGEPAERLHNLWPAIWAKMNREAVRECGKEGEIFFFTRAGYTGSVENAVMMWTGDQHVDWSVDDGLPSVIPATLSLAVSGFGLTHSDIGGYTTNDFMHRDEELMMRWEEMNVWSPVMRFHEGNQPWNNVQFDGSEALLKHLKKCADLHVDLKDYLIQCEEELEKEALPVMRPLFYYYDAPEAYTLKDEYLLGRDYLVAPVLRKGAVSRRVWLPEGNWEHYFTKERVGGGFHEVKAEIGMPPVFRRLDS